MLTRGSYEQLRSTYSLDVPPRFNYVRDVVDRWASSHPDKLALIAVEPDGIMASRYSFADISARASTAADLLAELGVEKGDRGLCYVAANRRVVRRIAWLHQAGSNSDAWDDAAYGQRCRIPHQKG